MVGDGLGGLDPGGLQLGQERPDRILVYLLRQQGVPNESITIGRCWIDREQQRQFALIHLVDAQDARETSHHPGLVAAAKSNWSAKPRHHNRTVFSLGRTQKSRARRSGTRRAARPSRLTASTAFSTTRRV